jgi:DNA repair protein RecO (recombination protein O)
MRHIVYSDFNKLYSFSIPPESAKRLSKITEKYLTEQVDFNFKTLDFLNSVID